MNIVIRCRVDEENISISSPPGSGAPPTEHGQVTVSYISNTGKEIRFTSTDGTIDIEYGTGQMNI